MAGESVGPRVPSCPPMPVAIRVKGLRPTAGSRSYPLSSAPRLSRRALAFSSALPLWWRRPMLFMAGSRDAADCPHPALRTQGAASELWAPDSFIQNSDINSSGATRLVANQEAQASEKATYPQFRSRKEQQPEQEKTLVSGCTRLTRVSTVARKEESYSSATTNAKSGTYPSASVNILFLEFPLRRIYYSCPEELTPARTDERQTPAW